MIYVAFWQRMERCETDFIPQCFSLDLDARPWDFQAEECALRSAVDRFNSRRYDKNSSGCVVMVWIIWKAREMKVHKTTFDRQDPEYEPIDNWLTSVLSHPVELTEEFKRHYEIWLQQEVFQASIDWDQLVASHLIWFSIPWRVYFKCVQVATPSARPSSHKSHDQLEANRISKVSWLFWRQQTSCRKQSTLFKTVSNLHRL